MPSNTNDDITGRWLGDISKRLDKIDAKLNKVIIVVFGLFFLMMAISPDLTKEILELVAKLI